MAKETRGINWNSEEIIELIESWASEEISNDFSGVYRNKHVYEKIAIALRGKGIDRTWESCRTKIKGLRQAYLRAKLHNNTSGQSRSRFVYFDKLDEFLGSKPLTEPSVLVDTTENVEEKVAVETNNDQKKDTAEKATVKVEKDEDNGKKDGENGEHSRSEIKQKNLSKEKTRKRTMDESLNNFVHALVDMEERQTKYQFDQEEKRRRLEDEAEQRRMESERQFQLQLYQMQAQMQMQMASIFMGTPAPGPAQAPGSAGDNESNIPIQEALYHADYFDL